MTAQQWGSRFVHIHQERTTKKIRAQEFTRPESFKDKMIQEGKSHPDPKDPSFPQYFKTKEIRSTSQDLEQKVSEANTDGNSMNTTETPSSAMPNQSRSNSKTNRRRDLLNLNEHLLTRRHQLQEFFPFGVQRFLRGPRYGRKDREGRHH
jgi:hypothetical protein